MQFKKIFPLLMVLPLVACGKGKNIKKSPLVIPNVDVENLTVNLPNLVERNSGAIKSDENYEYIDLYEISDFHGAVSYEPDHSSGVYLGLSKLASYFDAKRENNPGGTLLLSSGDMFQGSADSNLTRGYLVNYAMQYMGFDAMAIGNHEFDWTDEWLKKNATLKYNTDTPSIPFLGANIYKNGVLPDFLKKSTIVERGDYKIGVIGVIGKELENSILATLVAGYDFKDYSTIVSEEAARLKSEDGCSAVVLLAHDDAEKIGVCTGVDAVFGGHEHSDKISNANGVPSLATKNYGQSVAHLTFKFDKNTKEYIGVQDGYGIEDFSINQGDSLVDNVGVSKIMKEYEPSINVIKNIKLGTCDADLTKDEALKNICTKSMFDSAVASIKQNSLDIDTSKVIASFTNHEGGIRDTIKAGDITYGDVYRSFPFDNEIVLVKVNGDTLRKKLTNISNLGVYRTFQKRAEIDASTDYYIVTTDFVALSSYLGQGKLVEISEQDLVRTGTVIRDEIASFIYYIDNIKVANFANTIACYKPIPISF